MKVLVIIPAAGLGTRMTQAPDARSKKPAARRNSSPRSEGRRSLFTPCASYSESEVSAIYVALRANEIVGFQRKIFRLEGGEHRQQSVANAITAVAANADDIVLVHDAVRPFSN